MSKTSARKPLATMYALSLIWVVASIGGSVVLVQPLLLVYDTLGVESVTVQFAATMALVALLATSVTVAIGLVLRSHPEPEEVSNHS